MRKWLLALSCFLVSVSAQAHVSAVPFPEIGSLNDVTHQAAFSIVQTYLPPAVPQITCNIVTGVASVGGPCTSPVATCNGDVQSATRTISIANGTKILTTGGVSTFLPGDAGKTIVVPGLNSISSANSNTISTVDSPSQVTLLNSAVGAISAVSTNFSWGTDDAAAFARFNTWAQANQGSSNQVVLTVPAGSCWFGTSNAISGTSNNLYFALINNLIVEGTGATLNGLNGSGYALGAPGICNRGLTDVAGCSARIQSVSAGASTVTLTAASLSAGYISRFSVGNSIMLGGFAIQALWDSPFGAPPNLQFFEWRQITAINTGTGVITLDRPITNSYLSTWPLYNSGNGFQVDGGGPASIWVLPGWNITQEYRGMAFSASGQINGHGRNITYRNISVASGSGPIPSENETWSAYNANYSGINLEIDKLIGVMTLDNFTINELKFQSSSVDRLVMSNSTVTLDLTGTPKRADISDSTLASFSPGAYAYGVSQGPVTCTRCNVASFTAGGIAQANTPPPYTMSGGVISFPNTAASGSGPAQRIFVPGGNVYYSAASFFSVGLFQSVSITQDPWPSITDNQSASTSVTMDCSGAPTVLNTSGSLFTAGDVGKVIYIPNAKSGPSTLETWIATFNSATSVTVALGCSNSLVASTQTVQWGTSNVKVQTNEAGGFPTIASPITFRTHPAAQFTCDTPNPASDPAFIAACVQAGAAPLIPMESYASRNYAPASAAGNLTQLNARGRIVSVTINVTQAYSGTGAATLNPTGQFHNNTVKQSNWTTYDWVPTINLKQAGSRVITSSGTTCNGVAGPCAGDSCTLPSGGTGCYTLPEAVWFPNGLFPYMGSTLGVGNQPQFTMTVQTDQGVVP